MNHQDPRLGGEWPTIPEEPASGCRAMLIVMLSFGILVALGAIVVFIGRGGR
jgi:hypothetical protein